MACPACEPEAGVISRKVLPASGQSQAPKCAVVALARNSWRRWIGRLSPVLRSGSLQGTDRIVAIQGVKTMRLADLSPWFCLCQPDRVPAACRYVPQAALRIPVGFAVADKAVKRVAMDMRING